MWLYYSSLQEVAPLSYAFIGPYFLSPYYSRYEQALNLAAVKVLAGHESQHGESGDTGSAAMHGPQPYTLVRTKNVGMTAIMLFARTPVSLLSIEEAECGFGAADMGNKGAVALRVAWSDGKPAIDGQEQASSTELTFVATHLAAMEWGLKKRNSNWRSIVSGLTFENPKTAIPGVFPANATIASSEEGAAVSSAEAAVSDGDSNPDDEEDSDTRPLLRRQSSTRSEPFHPEHPGLTPEHHATLQEVSVFKPTSHLFLFGDLNYRLSTTSPPVGAPFPSFDPESPHYWPTFLPRDQLTQEKDAGRTLTGLSEAEIKFGPSYKYDVLSSPEGADNEAAARGEGGEVPWKWAPHRWPGWCDRILFLEVPTWARRRLRHRRQQVAGVKGKEGHSEEENDGVVVKAYNTMPVVATSDHRPVFLRVQVPVLGAKEMAPPAPPAAEDDDGTDETGGTLLDEDLPDPRVALPMPIDVHAWERRAAARRREIVVGLSMFLWSTREGALLIATALAVGIGGWWAWRLW